MVQIASDSEFDEILVDHRRQRDVIGDWHARHGHGQDDLGFTLRLDVIA
jgi:hypothetical protein